MVYTGRCDAIQEITLILHFWYSYHNIKQEAQIFTLISNFETAYADEGIVKSIKRSITTLQNDFNSKFEELSDQQRKIVQSQEEMKKDLFAKMEDNQK